MSALPCLPADERLTREAARQADRQRLRAMERQFDRGGYYWGGDSYDWSVYEWKDRNNPCTPSYYFNRTVQRNLLASDLGVIAKVGRAADALPGAQHLDDRSGERGAHRAA